MQSVYVMYAISADSVLEDNPNMLLCDKWDTAVSNMIGHIVETLGYDYDLDVDMSECETLEDQLEAMNEAIEKDNGSMETDIRPYDFARILIRYGYGVWNEWRIFTKEIVA